MPNMSVRYSHAAPFIRHRACLALWNVVNAPTKRQSAGAAGEFRGYVSALRILLSSDDYDASPGVANVDELPEDSVALVVDQLGAEQAGQLGIVA